MPLTTAPGTTVPYPGQGGVFALFRPMIAATDGLTLSQVCALTGLESSTLQNWVKRDFVPHPVRKKYDARVLARILLIASLRDGLPIEVVGELMARINGDTEDTSDDIISEDALYDDFCALLARLDETPPSDEALTRAAAEVTADFGGAPEAAARLRESLVVMACAWSAGRWKRRAEERLARLRTLQ